MANVRRGDATTSAVGTPAEMVVEASRSLIGLKDPERRFLLGGRSEVAAGGLEEQSATAPALLRRVDKESEYVPRKRWVIVLILRGTKLAYADDLVTVYECHDPLACLTTATDHLLPVAVPNCQQSFLEDLVRNHPGVCVHPRSDVDRPEHGALPWFGASRVHEDAVCCTYSEA